MLLLDMSNVTRHMSSRSSVSKKNLKPNSSNNKNVKKEESKSKNESKKESKKEPKKVDKRVTDKKVPDKKVADKKVADKKVADKKSADKKSVDKKVEKKDFIRNLNLVKKSDLKDKDYVSNDYPLNDIQRVNYPKFFCSLDSNLNNINLCTADLDTRSYYLSNFGITSPVGLKILSKSKKFNLKHKARSENQIEKWCSNDVQLIDLKNKQVDEMIKPFDLKIDRLTNCPICKKKLTANHSCLKKK